MCRCIVLIVFRNILFLLCSRHSSVMEKHGNSPDAVGIAALWRNMETVLTQ